MRNRMWQFVRAQTPAGSTSRVTTLCVSATLALSLSGVAVATITSTVVGPRGSASGGGYGYWLAVKDRVFFDTPAPGPKVCGTQHGPAGAVAFLLGGGRDQDKFTCKEPAGRPIYVGGLTSECSTLQGDHNGFGISPTALRRCARAGFRGLSATATVDGQRVANYPRLIATTRVIRFHLPRRNPFGIKPQDGRSVAYGEGLLLSRLSTGPHTIRITEHLPQGTNTVTYTVYVR